MEFMFYGVSHVDVQVTNLASSQVFYCDQVGFTVAAEGEGYVDVDAGGFTLRLVEVGEIERQVSLRVHVRDVDEALTTLRKAGCRQLYGKSRTESLEWMAAALDPDGHRLVLWRPLTEDEFGFEPDLPKEMTWQPEAEALLKSLLKHVPAMFRGLARRKCTRVIEELAEKTNLVTTDEVVRGYILSNARITRSRLVKPLKEHGFDPADFRAEFDYTG